MKLTTAEIQQYLNEGLTYKEIGELCGVTKQRIGQLVRQYKLTKRTKPEKPKTARDKRKSAFKLESHLYPLASSKFSTKRQNTLRAKKYEFSIKFEDLEWPSHCPILGIPLEYENAFDVRTEGSVSFDRIDSSKGYIPGNVRIISWRANRIKNDGTSEEHRKIADYMDSL